MITNVTSFSYIILSSSKVLYHLFANRISGIGKSLMLNIAESIDAVLITCNANQGKVLKCGSLSARNATLQLLVVMNQLKSLLSLDESKYHITVSYGSGYYPKMPWVGITPKGKKVSNSTSVSILFSNKGEGIVCGAMIQKGSNKKNLVSKRDIKDNPIILRTASRSYTNKFINPKDFLLKEISEYELVNHLKESIRLMDENIKFA